MGDTEFQPLTGDPTLLETKAAHYAEIADAIRRSVTTLRKIHDVDDMKSEAVDALKKSGDSVADDIDKAHDRYSKTAAALKTYAVGLREAQSDAETAITHINAKQTAADTAHTHATNTQQTADSATGDAKSDAQTAAGKAKDAAQHADAELRAAHQEWHNALDKKNAAAQVAIKAIVDVVDHHNNGLKNPGFWEKLGKAVLSAVQKICEVAGVLSIFFAWVPGLGAILVGLAILGSVITLVEAINSALHGGSWTAVVFAAAGVALTAFGGKFASYLGKLSKFQAASKVMTKGDNFLNSKAFKTVFGESKSALKSGKLKALFKEGTGLKTMAKDIRNPFSLNLGKGPSFAAKYADGFGNEFAKALKNPLGLKSLEMGKDIFTVAPWTPAKVGMLVMDGRSVLAKTQTLVNNGSDLLGHPVKITVKPESVLQLGVQGVEDKVR